MKLISIVLPAYKEQKNIPLMYETLQSEVLSKISDRYDYEIIFVNDGSPDGGKTRDEIVKLHKKDARVIGIDLSRNFGHQAALTAGLEHAKGDVIISMDCDLEHPVETALDMIMYYETHNVEIVYAKKVERVDGFWKKYMALWYYKILNAVSDTEIPRNVADYRLMTKKSLGGLLAMPERDKYLRGMVAWLGYKIGFVDFRVGKRIHGTSGYTRSKMIKLATDGILGFSTLPLKLGAYLGVILISVSTIFFLYMVIDMFWKNTRYPLYKWLSVGLVGLMGLQFVFMWMMSLYIGRVYNEVRGRPLYIVNEILGSK